MTRKKQPAPELIRRQTALAYVLNKYKGSPCDFATADCVRMTRTMLVKMGRKPPAMPDYRNISGARNALKAAGFDNLTGLFDSLLERVPPAAMLPGDIAVMPDEHGLGAAVIAVGNGRVIGWHEDGAEAVIIQPHQIDAAWRVAR